MRDYVNRVDAALDDAWRRCHTETRDLNSLRLVIFSDHHRGQLDGADDFSDSRPAYHAALAYYFSRGYELALLGDVEELWECRPQAVIKAYAETLEIEQQFAETQRLFRFVGNHDDHWLDPQAAEKHLGRYLCPEIQPRPALLEALRIEVTAQGQAVGSLLLTHGHQGSRLSDRHSQLSRQLVRYLWRPLQRLSRLRLATPAQDYSLRRKHELALFSWARRQVRTVLITGHTHQPIFPTLLHEQHVERRIARLAQKLEASRGTERLELENRVAELSAELAWTRAEALEMHSQYQSKPCYFNSGCCCYPDGEITGIELAEGEIRLVRWPDRTARPKRWILYKADLETVFDRCD